MASTGCFLVRGYKVQVLGNDLQIFPAKQITPHDCEQLTLQLLMYLDSEGHIKLNSTPRPKVDVVQPDF